MGLYCRLSIKGYPWFFTKNDVDPYILSLFDPEHALIKLEPSTEAVIQENEREEEERVVCFVSTGKIIKDRLNVIGYNLARARLDFETNKATRIELLRDRLLYPLDYEWLSVDEINSRLELLSISELVDFNEAAKYIIENNVSISDKVPIEDIQRNRLLGLFFENEGFDFFPVNNKTSLTRLVLDIFPDDVEVVYDITEVVEDHFHDRLDTIEGSTLYDYYIGESILPFDLQLGEKIIVLTEGSTDSDFLNRSLRLLYPHLSKYYSFIDFNSSKAPGGASALANTLKTFIGAGIKNRIVAVFDCDTAAQVAMNSLSTVTIPNNYRVIQYPRSELASNYPTIGPTGEMDMDVNNIACSIELYLGYDVLTEQERLIPIQWTGYEKSIRKYQGEILSKSSIQEKFRQKLAKCEQDKTYIQKCDFSGIDAILNAIFNAFG